MHVKASDVPVEVIPELPCRVEAASGTGHDEPVLLHVRDGALKLDILSARNGTAGELLQGFRLGCLPREERRVVIDGHEEEELLPPLEREDVLEGIALQAARVVDVRERRRSDLFGEGGRDAGEKGGGASRLADVAVRGGEGIAERQPDAAS